jgi:hypothetical protein
MDPDEVLRLFRQALAEHQWRDAVEYADALDGWMTAGGYAPEAWTRQRGYAQADLDGRIAASFASLDNR